MRVDDIRDYDSAEEGKNEANEEQKGQDVNSNVSDDEKQEWNQGILNQAESGDKNVMNSPTFGMDKFMQNIQEIGKDEENQSDHTIDIQKIG